MNVTPLRRYLDRLGEDKYLMALKNLCDAGEREGRKRRGGGRGAGLGGRRGGRGGGSSGARGTEGQGLEWRWGL